MIKTETKKGESVKQIRKREAEAKEKALHEKCEAIAVEKFTKEQLTKWSNEFKGLWYLPVLDESEETIEALAILKPINRSILSYASTKIEDGEGLYDFLEAAMRECFVAGDQKILEEDEYFIPAAQKFNKILKGKNAALLKKVGGALKAAERDVAGLLETIVEYYTGRDASAMTDEALVLKVAHIVRIRRLEGESSLSKVINLLK